MIGWIILVIVVVVIGYAVLAYNNLVRQRQLAQEGWSGIDVQLNRRADLIPNLLESVKGYMAHERETLEASSAPPPKAPCRRRWENSSPSPRPIPISRRRRTSSSSRPSLPTLRTSCRWPAATTTAPPAT